ncbi:HK97 family phage prohead protease [Nitrospirillum amazonense]|uniref:Prohead serine protease n=1 Tax=Nitrospirillum amazonense TaxID=28077 RepID=A0A560KH31_9PROT|nr:HK97 family phage prohead protease [Nitrospirillum amazonense]MDG3443250.1 HK97 family phage prohead protease [Nitrospirillum amazonense]TWB82611.1 prohead serine protease [Nitrospirillum amazonense]
MRLFGNFTKVEEGADGTLMVEGIATTETVDGDGEVVEADAVKAALPDFLRLGSGPLREMHQPLAAGRVDAAAVGADRRTRITATVVDPVAIRKVKAGVYKGFSIGGKVVARDPDDRNTITALRLTEISLVDRPANPDAVITLVKLEDTDMTDTDASSKKTDGGGDCDALADCTALATILKALSAAVAGLSAEDMKELLSALEAANTDEAPDDDADAEEDEAPDDKTAALGIGDLRKALDRARADRAGLLRQRDALAARVKALEAQPRAEDYVLKAAVAGTAATKTTLDDPATALDAIKKAQRHPAHMTPAF